MNKKLLNITLAASVSFAMVACGDNHDERNAALQKKVSSLAPMGIDVNQTSANEKRSTYLLTIKNSTALSNKILSSLDMQTLQQRERVMLQNALNGVELGLEIDWDKYYNNKDNSLYAYYINNDTSIPQILKNLVSKKNLGAYLSYDEKDALRQISLKDIDESVLEDNRTFHMAVSGYGVEDIKHSTNSYYPISYKIVGKSAKMEVGKEDSKEIEAAMSLNGFNCDVNRENKYLGQTNCQIPSIIINDNDEDISIKIDGIILKSQTVKKGDKVSSTANFYIKTFEFHGDNGKSNLAVNGIKIDVDVSGMDAKAIDDMYAVMNENNVSQEKIMKELSKYMEKLFVSGIKYNVALGVESADVKGSDFTMAIKGINYDVDSSLAKTIDHKESITIDLIEAKDKAGKKVLFKLKNAKYGLAIKDMRNIIGKFLSIVFDALIESAGDPYKLDRIMEKKISKTMPQELSKLVNDGFSISIDPISLDELTVEIDRNPVAFDKAKLQIDATLAKNKLDMANPMAPMMALGYLKSNGKMVLTKKDFDFIVGNLPPMQGQMAKMFAKSEGDNVVFELEFKDQHLTINGKPVM